MLSPVPGQACAEDSGIFWGTSGGPLWESLGPLRDLWRTSGGGLVRNLGWTSSPAVLATPRRHPGSALAAPWQLPGSTPAAAWQRPGSTPAATWQHGGGKFCSWAGGTVGDTIYHNTGVSNYVKFCPQAGLCRYVPKILGDLWATSLGHSEIAEGPLGDVRSFGENLPRRSLAAPRRHPGSAPAAPRQRPGSTLSPGF